MNRYLLKLCLVTLVIIVTLNKSFELVTASDYKLAIINENTEIKTPYVKIDEITYFPVCLLFESFGWKTNGDSQNKQLTIIKDGNKIVLNVGKTEFFVNGYMMLLNKPPFLIDGVIYVESMFISQNLGENIIWNKEDNLIVTNQILGDVNFEGKSNIVVIGNGMIINVTEAYNVDTLNEMVTEADAIFKSGLFKDALRKYEHILKNISKEDNRESYAHITVNMGNSYLSLAKVSNMKSNLLFAILKYEEALKYIKKDNEPDKYYYVLKSYANAQGLLGETNEDKVLIDKSIRGYLEALDYFKSKKNFFETCTICYEVGRLYCFINDIKRAEENFIEANQACLEILKNCTLDENQALYGDVQFNLGNIYKEMSKLSGKEEHFKQSKMAYEEALKVWDVEISPLNYANTYKCIGDLYKIFYLHKYGDMKENLLKSRLSYQEALKIKTVFKYPSDYAQICCNIGEVFIYLYNLENKYEDLKNAIDYYTKALPACGKGEFDYSVLIEELILRVFNKVFQKNSLVNI